MPDALAVAQLTASGLVLAHGAWWSVLAAVAVRRPGTLLVPPPGEPRPAIAVLVPAHNEAASVSATVRSLLGCPYGGRAELIVIADNCTDETASVAARAGATVVGRDEPTRRGKSFALRFGLAALEATGDRPDFVCVVDADTQVEPNFLSVVSARLAGGASAVQVHYRAAAGTTDLTRVRRLAFALVHWARPLGLGRMGFSGGLKGNGMAFRWDAAEVALSRDGLAEDAAATLALALAGVPVVFEPRTAVTGLMASEYRSAGVQDTRWERGRLGLMPAGFRTALACVRRGRVRLLPAVFETVSLPLTLLAALGISGALAALAGFGSITLAAGALCSLGAYVTLGMLAARPSLADIAAVRSVPRFLAHKLSVFGNLALRRGSPEWKRTARD
jgi:cellulose synthase/poly-beta-1,6-N-acetylglucosamine synthase-like glycosyltransferase